MPDGIRRGKQYEQDQSEPSGWPSVQIRFIPDEAQAIFGTGKSSVLDALISDALAKGHEVEMIDVKVDPELARMLAAKREEIERDLPGWSAGPRWGRVKLTPFEITYPVRVGDVVRVIDTMWGDRPVPGHVVDIDGWWVYVSGPLGRKIPFYGQTGYLAGEYRWRLEPYITEEESSQ